MLATARPLGGREAVPLLRPAARGSEPSTATLPLPRGSDPSTVMSSAGSSARIKSGGKSPSASVESMIRRRMRLRPAIRLPSPAARLFTPAVRFPPPSSPAATARRSTCSFHSHAPLVAPTTTLPTGRSSHESPTFSIHPRRTTSNLSSARSQRLSSHTNALSWAPPRGVLARPPPEDVWNRRGGASPEDACKTFADSSQATHVA